VKTSEFVNVSYAGARLSLAEYQDLYQRSIKDPDAFWAEQANRIDWLKKWSSVKNTTFSGDVSIRWFEGGVLNASYNCLDRHLSKHAQKVAYFWEPDHPEAQSRKITYQELFEMTCRLANVLKSMGVKKGDRVTIYMPMIPESVAAMLACARMGAIHSVVFGGFSPDSIADRLIDCDSHWVITADEARRGGKTIPLKSNIDKALEKAPHVKKVLVFKHTGSEIPMHNDRDLWALDLMKDASPHCEAEPMGAEDPLFILYTSGSTNKPKAVLHTTGGYLVYASLTHEMIFDHRSQDVYWCTADIGWVTGHSYVVYGPLSNGATSVIFEGVPTFPSAARSWEVCDKYNVSIFYTAPTALRTLMREGLKPLELTSRKSLRVLGTVGEPINPEVWLWYFKNVGGERCPVVDTWWQTETGGILISPLAGVTPLKPGSATLPFFGVRPVIVDAEGRELEGACEGNLCLVDSWPGQMRTVYRDHERFRLTYFSTFPGRYFTGDGCRRDEDGYYWITGRVDDVINVAGHRLGTAEIESALVSHPQVAESAVVGCPHEIKGQGIYAFVTLKAGVIPSETLKAELMRWVRKEISPIATPDKIQWAASLPKTRSGKIMRRILRKIAEGSTDSLGDTSTLADPQCVTDLISNKV